MMMKHSEILRHCGIKTRINHSYPLDLAQHGVHIALEPTPWRRQDAVSGKRAAFLNNFSAAGENTAILLEDAPVRAQQLIVEKDSRPVQIVAVTAKSPKSLVANINSLNSFLEKKGPSVSLAALSYTTTARRMHHNYRIVVSGSDVDSILSALKFSGQGTLYAELGKSLFVTNAPFRASILRLNRLAEIQGFPAFLGLIDGSTTTADVPGRRRRRRRRVATRACVCPGCADRALEKLGRATRCRSWPQPGRVRGTARRGGPQRCRCHIPRGHAGSASGGAMYGRYACHAHC